MTNRDKVLKMCTYDLLIKVNNLTKCVVESLGNLEREDALKRCRKFDSCEKCIQAWLNEKE